MKYTEKKCKKVTQNAEPYKKYIFALNKTKLHLVDFLAIATVL